MQEIILNTKNLNVIAESVDDLIVVEEPNDNNETKKLRIAGIRLGNLKIYKYIIF